MDTKTLHPQPLCFACRRPLKITRDYKKTPARRASINAHPLRPQMYPYPGVQAIVTLFSASARQTSLEVKQHSTFVLLPPHFIFKRKVSQSDRQLKQTLCGSVTHLFPWPQLNVVRADAARLNAAIRPLEMQQYSLFQMSEQNGPTPHV